MRVFDASWQYGEGTLELELPPVARAYLVVQVSCTEPVTLLGMREGKAIPLQTGPQWRARIKASDFEAFALSGSVPFGYSVQARELQDGDPINDEDPPAAPMPGADNLVAQFHRMLRDNARRNAAPYMDPEELPFSTRYEVEDNDRFEEDDLRIAQAEAKKRKAEAKKAEEAKKTSSHPQQSEPASQGRSEPPEGASAPPGATDPQPGPTAPPARSTRSQQAAE